MKQYSSSREGLLGTFTDWSLWGAGEFAQAFLGLVWIGFLCGFIMFFYTYRQYYTKGVYGNDKGYYLTYLDLRKVIRKIAGAFLMFLVGSYCLSFAPEFPMTLMKGAVMSAFVFPPVYMHYSDETKYKFYFNKGD